MATPDELSIRKRTNDNQLTKTYIDYDASNRAEYIYTAPSHAADGDACLLTRIGYDGVSQRVTYKKESPATWSVAWETF